MKFYLSLPLSKVQQPGYDMQSKQGKTVKEARFTEDSRSQGKI